ncbi:hypothetical protein Bca4012_065141 [Brassica carinata]
MRRTCFTRDGLRTTFSGLSRERIRYVCCSCHTGTPQTFPGRLIAFGSSQTPAFSVTSRTCHADLQESIKHLTLRARQRHHLPTKPDIPMHDGGDFQRVVVDAQAIWARVSRCRCSSRRSVKARSPSAAGPSRQHQSDSSKEIDETGEDTD